MNVVNVGLYLVQRDLIGLRFRSEIDGILPGEPEGYVAIHALNEYSPARSVKPWRVQLELQKVGTILGLLNLNV